MTIKRIDPVSVAKIAAVIYAVIGFLIGGIFSLLAVFGLALTGSQNPYGSGTMSPLIGGAIGIGAVIVSPILYGIMGFIFALIGAWIYNMVAASVGGIQIEVI